MTRLTPILLLLVSISLMASACATNPAPCSCVDPDLLTMPDKSKEEVEEEPAKEPATPQQDAATDQG